MADIDLKTAKLRRALIIVIVATLPLYLLGMIVLWVGDAARNSLTPTPEISTVIVTATPQPNTALPSPTAFPTFTPTRTFTPTHTATATFTATATHTPTPTPTHTPLPSPTDTPTPEPTQPPTQVPTDTLPATIEPTLAVP